MTDVENPKDDVNHLAEYLRSKKSHLVTSDGVYVEMGKRVEIFYGKHITEVLNRTNFKLFSDLKGFIDYSPEDFDKDLNTMLERSYFKRVKPVEIKKKRYDASHATRVALEADQVFTPDGMYMWVMERNSKFALAKAIGVIAVIIGVCCFKIWPIWMKIAVWWFTILVLVSLITMIILHVVSGACFFVIGMRGTYFMPNLFDEEIFFLDTFSPLFGKGGEHQAKWKEERELQIRIKTAKKDLDAGKTDVVTPVASEANIWLSWQMAAFNALLFVVVGGVVGYYMGIFSPEAVPEFVISSKEMHQYFPSLAPPVEETIIDDAEEVDLDFE